MQPSEFRGVNYVPNTTHHRDNIQGTLSPQPTEFGDPTYDDGSSVPFGQFRRDLVRQELCVLRDLGFEQIRVWTSFLAWVIDRDDCLANLRSLFAVCRELGLRVEYIVWSTTHTPEATALGLAGLGAVGGDLARFASTVKTVGDDWHRTATTAATVLPVPPGSQLHGVLWAEPDPQLVAVAGPPDRWPNVPGYGFTVHGGQSLEQLVDRYLDDLFAIMMKEYSGVVVGFDLYNEPEVLATDGVRIDNVVDFIAHTWTRLIGRAERERLPRPLATLGMGNPNNLVPFYTRLFDRHGIRLSHGSFHTYAPDEVSDERPEPLDPWLAQMQRVARLADGLPTTSGEVVCSEFYAPFQHPVTAGAFDRIVAAIDAVGFGAFSWAVLESNAFNVVEGVATPVDGLFVPFSPDAGVNDAARDQLRVDRSAFPEREIDVASLLAWAGGREPVYDTSVDHCPPPDADRVG